MDDHERIERLERQMARVLPYLHTLTRRLNWLETTVQRLYDDMFPARRRERKDGPPSVDVDDSQWMLPDLDDEANQ